jgi:putative transposase
MSTPTMWKIPEFAQGFARKLIDAFYPQPATGRRHRDLMPVLDACLYRLRTGCQWRALPKEFGSPSTLHFWFQRFCQDGFFLALWRAMLAIAEALGIIYLTWLSMDGSMVKARARGNDAIGPNPTDRAKPGVKRSLLTDELGGPIGLAIAGANRHDSKLAEETLKSSLVPLRRGRARRSSHLLLDKGYDTPDVRRVAKEFGVMPHIRKIGEERKSLGRHPTKKARRWVVERSNAWYNECRGLATRYDVKAQNYLGLCHLRNALIWASRITKECGF